MISVMEVLKRALTGLRFLALIIAISALIFTLLLNPFDSAILAGVLAILYFVMKDDLRNKVNSFAVKAYSYFNYESKSVGGICATFVFAFILTLSLGTKMLEITKLSKFTTPDFPGVTCERFHEAKGIITLTKCDGNKNQIIYTTRVMENAVDHQFIPTLKRALKITLDPNGEEPVRMYRIIDFN